MAYVSCPACGAGLSLTAGSASVGVCIDCGKHSGVRDNGTPWKRCWGCSQAYQGTLATCRECGERKHDPKYAMCYDCNQLLRGAPSADSSADEGVASEPPW